MQLCFAHVADSVFHVKAVAGNIVEALQVVRKVEPQSLCLSQHLHLATLVSVHFAIGDAKPYFESVVVAFASVCVAQHHLGYFLSHTDSSVYIDEEYVHLLVVRSRRERRLANPNNRSKHGAL